MSKRVTVWFADDPMDEQSWQAVASDDLFGEIQARYPEGWPPTARIYHETVAQENDVTPKIPQDVAALSELDGTFYVVVYPEGPTALLVLAIGAVVVAAALLFQQVDVPDQNVQSASPNNALNRRTNSARPAARIPDIFGQVRAVPDLIGQPYVVYEDHVQTEIAAMCLGRGAHDITDIREGETLASEIDGVAIEIYGPDTSPNMNVTPQQVIGPLITPPIPNRPGRTVGVDMVSVFDSNAVNGQELIPPNSAGTGGLSVNMVAPGQITLVNPADFDFTTLNVGDTVFTRGTKSFRFDDDDRVRNITVDYGGEYLITQIVSASEITVDSNWQATVSAFGQTQNVGTVSGTADIEPNVDNWIGPFELPVDVSNGAPTILLNVVARNGLYRRSSSGGQTAENIDFEIEYTAVDSSGAVIGTPQFASGEILGDAFSTGLRAASVQIEMNDFSPSVPTSVRVRTRRINERDYRFDGQVQDLIQWEELYTLNQLGEIDFGDVTTILARTTATERALGVQQRQLNMLATRRIPVRQPDGSFSTPQATRNASDIIRAVTIDPFIGRRGDSQLDLTNIYDTVDAVEMYFGNAATREFNFTFDTETYTYEKTVTAIAQALFCTPYLQGSQLRLAFENPNQVNRILFNHRNKSPRSETRTYTFGNQEQRDGVEFEYIDPNTDTQAVIQVPTAGVARNPKKIRGIGIRTEAQAHLHAWRAFNKLRYQVIASRFDSSGEANLLVRGDRVLNADNTRPETMDGDVLEQTQLTLRLSQPVTLADGVSYVIHLQQDNATIDTVPITAGADDFHITLSRAPARALVTSGQSYAQTTYIITSDADQNVDSFLVDEIDPEGPNAATVTLINWDARFYANDQDRNTA